MLGNKVLYRKMESETPDNIIADDAMPILCNDFWLVVIDNVGSSCFFKNQPTCLFKIKNELF